MPKLIFEVTRGLFAALALICIIAVALLDLRSGPALALFVLFVLFGAVATLLSLRLPFPGRARKKRW